MPAHSDTKYMIPSQPVFALSPYCCVFSREATYTNFIVFGIKVTTPFCFIFSRAWRWRNGIGKIILVQSSIIVSLQEKFEDTIYEAVIRSRKWKNRQHNGQNKKCKRTNNDLQNIHVFHWSWIQKKWHCDKQNKYILYKVQDYDTCVLHKFVPWPDRYMW